MSASSRNAWPFPFSEDANTSPRVRPSPEVGQQLLERLLEQWQSVAGPKLAAITKPKCLAGAKLRRLVVEADYSSRPPWGSWQALDQPSERHTFTEFRAAVNRCLAPHEVDHIDFEPTTE
jgi:hypothetical protein